MMTLLVAAFLCSTAFSQSGPRRRVAFAPPSSAENSGGDPAVSKLSSDLAFIVRRNATLLGQTRDGRLMVEGQAARLQDLDNGLTAQSTDSAVGLSDQLIVTYSAGKKPSSASLRSAGFQILDTNEEAGFLVVSPLAAQPGGPARAPGIRAAAVLQLASVPETLKVSRNVVLSIPDVELSPRRVQRSELTLNAASANSELDRVKGISRTGAPAARNFSEQSDVIVAVIDTGVEFDHHDLAANMWVNVAERDGVAGVDDDQNGVIDDVHGAAFVNGRQVGNPRDDNGHGTHCAGTIAAVANGQGVVGMAQAKIMALKFLTRNGGGLTSDAVRCIDYAIRNEAKIMSNSWGGQGSVTPVLEQAIERAQRAGILFVAAAGNDNRNIDRISYSPANSRNDNVLTVGAINFAGRRSGFSNFGTQNVDIGAPGGTGAPADSDDILSTYLNDDFAFLPGTSVATPHVSGAAALLLGTPEFRNRPDRTVIDLKQALLRNAKRNPMLAGQWLNGNELDLSFLKSPTGGAPDPGPGSDVPDKTFFYPQAKVFTGNATLITRKIRLNTPASVTLFAGASASGISGPQTFSTGIRIGDTQHKPSFRLMTSGGSDDYVSFGTTLTTQLEAGVHDVSWWIRLPKNGRLAVRGGGSLDVQAFAKN
jgi:subtilisin family serine protease